MFRIDFEWCILENVEELLLSVFLHAWARAYVRSLYSCVCNSILVYVGMFSRFCICGDEPVYMGFCLRTWVSTCVRETPGRSPTLLIFTPFSTISLPYAFPTHLFVIFAPEYHYIILFYLHSCIENIIFHHMSKIDFGWCILENVEELSLFVLFVFLCAWAQACVCSLHSCVRSSVLAYAGMFLRFCTHKDGLTYVGFDPRMRDS